MQTNASFACSDKVKDLDALKNPNVVGNPNKDSNKQHWCTSYSAGQNPMVGEFGTRGNKSFKQQKNDSESWMNSEPEKYVNPWKLILDQSEGFNLADNVDI